MQSFLNSQVGVYIVMILLSILGGLAIRLIHSAVLRIEQWVQQQLPASEAAQVNAILDTLDRLVATSVQDANSRIVVGLKQNGLFTKATQDSVKQAVIKDVMESLGPLKEKMAGTLGPLDRIVGQLVEANVLKHKPMLQTAGVQGSSGPPNGTQGTVNPIPTNQVQTVPYTYQSMPDEPCWIGKGKE